MAELSQNELLQFAIDNGMIDLDKVQEIADMQQREKYLEMHPYKVWQSEDGKWHTHFMDENGKRKRKDRKTKEEIENFIIECYQSNSIVTIEDVFNEWNDRRLDLEKISEPTHLRNKQIFKRHYSEFGKKDIKKIHPEEFIDFLEEQPHLHNIKAKAYSNLKSITRGFLKRAKKRKLIDWSIQDMFDDIDVSDKEFKPNIIDDSKEVFDEDEMAKVIDYCINNKDIYNLSILLMFVTGIRIGEIVTLKYDDFCYDNNAFQIKRTERRISKDSGSGYDYVVKDFPKTEAGYRTVIIPSSFQFIYKDLRKINPFGEYVFENAGKRIITCNIRTRLYKICRDLNIQKKSPHKIRKTYGSILLDNNLDSKLVTGQMGHTNLLCTEIHYHRNRKSYEQKQIAIDNIQELNCIRYSG